MTVCKSPDRFIKTVHSQCGGNPNGKDALCKWYRKQKQRLPWCPPSRGAAAPSGRPRRAPVGSADAGNIPVDEKAPDMVNISLGTLPLRADLEVPEQARDARLADRSRQVITTGTRESSLVTSLPWERGYSRIWDSPTSLIWTEGCGLGRTLACPPTKPLPANTSVEMSKATP